MKRLATKLHGGTLATTAALITWLLACGSAVSADEAAQAPVVVARVGGEPIYAAEVIAELNAVLKNRKVDAAARPRLLAEMLALLVDQRLVLAYLESRHEAADPQQVDAQMRKMSEVAKQRGTSLDAHAASRGTTPAALRTDVNWRLSWKNYLDSHVTDAVLEQYFNAHRRDFDGTQIRASQILLAVPADASAREAVLAKAADLRGQIAAGKLKFDDAATQFSTATSKGAGGDLGYLERHGSVPEEVATALFSLDKDQLTPPIVTPFGVHLLRVTDVKPGQGSWSDAKTALKSAVVQQGFRRIADAQRPRTPVEFSGPLPHLDPQSGRLVTP